MRCVYAWYSFMHDMGVAIVDSAIQLSTLLVWAEYQSFSCFVVVHWVVKRRQKRQFDLNDDSRLNIQGRPMT